MTQCIIKSIDSILGVYDHIFSKQHSHKPLPRVRGCGSISPRYEHISKTFLAVLRCMCMVSLDAVKPSVVNTKANTDLSPQMWEGCS